MLRSRSLNFFLVAVVTAVCAIYGLQAYSTRQASFNKTARVRGLPKELATPHFRLAWIQDSIGDHLHVMAIEKHSANTKHDSLQPSFCELDSDHTSNSAMMYIDGQPIIPTSDLIVFMAEYGASPRRIVVDRRRFDEIFPLKDDANLWKLCLETVTASSAVPASNQGF